MNNIENVKQIILVESVKLNNIFFAACEILGKKILSILNGDS